MSSLSSFSTPLTTLCFPITIKKGQWSKECQVGPAGVNSYEPGTRLKKEKNGISKLSYFKGQTNKQGLGYDLTMDKGKKTIFISKGLSK